LASAPLGAGIAPNHATQKMIFSVPLTKIGAWAADFTSLQLVHSTNQISYLSLIALPAEVEQLRQQFADKVIEIKPKAFAMWLLVAHSSVLLSNP